MDKESEERILPQQLLEEIYPLLEDYFEGVQECREGELIMRFENGQSFRLTVEECE